MAIILRRIAFALLIYGLFSGATSAQERLTNFSSDIRVETNGVLDVTETISIQAEGIQFRRGILRTFPTAYRNDRNEIVRSGFTVVSVTRNGAPEKYALEPDGVGIRVRIGDANVQLTPGQHTYAIRYRVINALGLYDQFDELYWNVTGTGWNFTIDNAEARVTLPQAARISQSAFYTGAQGEKGKDAEVKEEAPNRIVWKTTRALPPNNGLTIAVGWQRDVIERPKPPQQILREKFTADYSVKTWVSESALLANPFVYQGQTVAVMTRFVRMTSPTEALFGFQTPMRVSRVPTTLFTQSDTAVILAIRMDGPADLTSPDTGVPVAGVGGTFVGAFICQQVLCAEFISAPR